MLVFKLRSESFLKGGLIPFFQISFHTLTVVFLLFRNVMDIVTKKILATFAKLNQSKYIDIVITTFNRKIYLERCILSILAASTMPVRIFVGDDYSTDGTNELLKEYKQRKRIVDFFVPPQKAGTANLFNMLISNYVNSKFFIITNDDMWFRYGYDVQLATHVNKYYKGLASMSFYDYTNLKIGKRSHFIENNLVKTVATGLGCSLISKVAWDKTTGFKLKVGKTMGFFASKWCLEANGKHYSIVPPYALHMDHVTSHLSERINLGDYIDYRVKHKK